MTTNLIKRYQNYGELMLFAGLGIPRNSQTPHKTLGKLRLFADLGIPQNSQNPYKTLGIPCIGIPYIGIPYIGNLGFWDRFCMPRTAELLVALTLFFHREMQTPLTIFLGVLRSALRPRGVEIPGVASNTW